MFDEYPKLLYRGAGTGDYVSVTSDADEQAARTAGYGEYVSEYAPAVQVVAEVKPVEPEVSPETGDADAIRN